jgi:hypothetical protein
VDNIEIDLRDIYTGMIWLRIGTGGELLRTFEFHKILGSSWWLHNWWPSKKGSAP